MQLIKSFVQRGVKEIHRQILAEHLPAWQVNLEELQAAEKVVLEIGFGDGEFLLGHAALEPEALHIGVEPYIPGVANIITNIQKYDVQNIRLHNGDVREWLVTLPDALLDMVYIICPDPWPKNKQQKRRLLQSEFFTLLMRKVRANGKVLVATDHYEYALWIHRILTAQQYIDIPLNDCTTAPTWWLSTKYQRRDLTKQGTMYFFTWSRV